MFTGIMNKLRCMWKHRWYVVATDRKSLLTVNENLFGERVETHSFMRFYECARCGKRRFWSDNPQHRYATLFKKDWVELGKLTSEYATKVVTDEQRMFVRTAQEKPHHHNV